MIGAGARMQRAIQELRYQGKIDNSLAQTQNITLDYLEDAIRGFVEAAQNWTERAGATDLGNPMAVRMLNDQIMEMDRIFINKFENGEFV